LYCRANQLTILPYLPKCNEIYCSDNSIQLDVRCCWKLVIEMIFRLKFG